MRNRTGNRCRFVGFLLSAALLACVLPFPAWAEVSVGSARGAPGFLVVAGGNEGDGDIVVRIHTLSGHLRVDWIDDTGSLAWSEWDDESGAWSAPRHEAYTWGGSTGESEQVARERARARVRTRVLGN